jgi:hypothetical protein
VIEKIPKSVKWIVSQCPINYVAKLIINVNIYEIKPHIKDK